MTRRKADVPPQAPMLEEPRPEQKPRTATHGLHKVYVGKDGIKREIELLRLSDGAMGFHFRTWWDGEDKEPMETGVCLGMEAFNLFNHMVTAFHADRERYALRSDQ